MRLLIIQNLAMLAVLFSSAAVAIEKPEYEVVHAEGAVEYRRYASYIIAETEIIDAEDWNDASNEGFRRLFDYITGDNSGQEKIAMTAPVQQSRIQLEDVRFNRAEPQRDGAGWKVSFMLPSSYSINDAPLPEDERIRIRVVPEKLVAAIRYSGRWTTRNFDKFESRLLAAISEANIDVLGVPETAFYNPPFIPPFMRRNEIMVEVASLPGNLN